MCQCVCVCVVWVGVAGGSILFCYFGVICSNRVETAARSEFCAPGTARTSAPAW